MRQGDRVIVEGCEYDCIGVDMRMGDTKIDLLLQDARHPGTTRTFGRVVNTEARGKYVCLWDERDQYFAERQPDASGVVVFDVVGSHVDFHYEDGDDDTTEVTQPYGYPEGR